MSEAAVSFGAYQRTGNPTLAANNCFAEEYPSANGKRVQMRSRAGYDLFKALGSGPIRCAHQKDGLFDGAAIVVSATTASTLSLAAVQTDFTGTLAGDGFLDVDSGQDADLNSVVRFATGDALYKGVGGILTLEDFPEVGGAGATSVCYHRGFWLAVKAGTDQVYVQIPGDATWDPLSFSSAEYAPDALECVRSRGDQIALMGRTTFEVFTLSGDATDPIIPYGGLAFDFGCRARATAVNCKGSLLFVDNACNVRRWEGGEPSIVSGPGLAELIRSVGATDLRAWFFTQDGKRYYVLTIGSVGTWVYALEGVGDRWTTFSSLGYDYWRAHLGCSIGDVTLACDSLTANVYRLDPSLRYDNDTQFPVRFCAMVEGGDGPIPCSNVALLCDMGDAPRSGQGSAPIISLRWSDNQGKTFGAPRERPLPVTGDYTTIPRWNGLGDIPAMLGRIFEFTVTDPVGRIFKQVRMNIP